MTGHPWETLVKAALLGLERGAPDLPTADGALGVALASISAGDTESRWLDAAAMCALHTRAGRTPPSGKYEPTPCPDEKRPVCGERARRYFETLLNGRFEQVLPECLAALDAAGKRLPEALVPALLERAGKLGHARDALRGCSGEVGRWLSQQNPSWRAVYAEDDAAAWHEGNIHERSAWLKALRARDPEKGREALVQAWAKEDSRERATLLACLKTGLSIDDEPLLESALDDKRKEVRQAAWKLLARIPGSRYVQRMRERLKPLLSVDKRGGISVEVPAQLDDSMRRDGMEQASQVKELGDKAWQLMFMVACVPPSEWCKGGATPEKLLKSADKTDWALALRLGWSLAAGSFGEVDWIRPLLKKHVNMSWQDTLRRMLLALPVREREDTLVEITTFEYPDLFTWPEFVPEEWSEKFSVEAARRLAAMFKSWSKHSWHQQQLPKIAARMNTLSFDTVAELLDPAKHEAAENAAHEVLDLLRFRKDALNAIKEKP